LEINQLKHYVENLIASSDADFFRNLEERKKEEVVFHNLSRSSTSEENTDNADENRYGDSGFYSVTKHKQQYLLEQIRRFCHNKVVLDFACGNGNQVLMIADAGSALTIGIDISDVSIRNARNNAELNHRQETCLFLQADCENTGLPDNSIDVIFANAVFHHLNLENAYKEIYRLLKKGGAVIAAEPLNYNPFFNLYRRMTPSKRTKWEIDHFLKMKDLNSAKKYFQIHQLRFWHFTVMLASVLPKNAIFRFTEKILHKIDNVLLKIPGIRLMAWQFTFILLKE